LPQPFQRRQFLAGGAAGAFLCALGGERTFPFSSAKEVAEADAAARAVKKPPPVAKDPVDTM